MSISIINQSRKSNFLMILSSDFRIFGKQDGISNMRFWAWIVSQLADSITLPIGATQSMFCKIYHCCEDLMVSRCCEDSWSWAWEYPNDTERGPPIRVLVFCFVLIKKGGRTMKRLPRKKKSPTTCRLATLQATTSEEWKRSRRLPRLGSRIQCYCWQNRRTLSFVVYLLRWLLRRRRNKLLCPNRRCGLPLSWEKKGEVTCTH